MAEQEKLAMAERVKCKCPPVDYDKRRKVHRALHAADKGGIKKYKSVSCSERHGHKEGQHFH